MKRNAKATLTIAVFAAAGSFLAANAGRGSDDAAEIFADLSEQQATRLLETGIVQTELALTTQQIKRVKLVDAAIDLTLQGWVNSWLDLPQSQRGKGPVGDPTAAERKALRELLRPEQWARLREILTQRSGARFFDMADNPNSAKDLGVTREQADRISGVIRTLDSEMEKRNRMISDLGLDVPHPPSKEWDVREGKVREFERRVRDAALSRILSLLTPSQRREYHRLTGKSIDVNRLDDELMQTLQISRGQPSEGSYSPNRKL